MSGFHFKPLGFADLESTGKPFLIKNFYQGDSRGGFTKYFEKDIFKAAGIPFKVTEMFISRSEKNVMRGLHFQLHDPQAKLVSVPYGRVWDVIVDLRPESPTLKKWAAVELSAQNRLALLVPRGFAHGFVALEDGTLMLYQCDGTYDKGSDTGVRFNDPDLAIQWPIKTEDAIHSQRDLHLMSFSEYMDDPMRC